jgi:carbon monoxide dehydrogenase subunit G
MVIEGRYEIDGVPPERVFAGLGDPAILARSIPGCRELADSGDDTYELVIEAGVGAIRGTYAGQVKIGERRPHDLYEAALRAAGSAGSVEASMRAELLPRGGGTTVAYWLDAKLAGAIAGVGQRVLSGASRKNATAFLDALSKELVAGNPSSPDSEGGAEAPTVAPPTAEEPDAPRVYGGRSASAGTDTRSFSRGVVVGFALSAATFTIAAVLDRIRGRR